MTIEGGVITLFGNETEAANRAEATVLLIRAGYRVYRPEADVHGEDLVIRDPIGNLRSVQLKSRPAVDWHRYGDRGTWLLFPEPGYKLGRDWFLIEHDRLYAKFLEHHGHTKMQHDGKWSTTGISKGLRSFLECSEHAHWAEVKFRARVVATGPSSGDDFERRDRLDTAGRRHGSS